MNLIIKKIASYLPVHYQQEFKRIHYFRQIKSGKFDTGERDLETIKLNKGDWILDIGANIGQYTLKFSEIVGENGRVIAFEPVPQTFELLAANASRAPFRNISLLNVAASDTNRISGMQIPRSKNGLNNFYKATLTNSGNTFQVLCIRIDNIEIGQPISLVKIDAEGHEYQVLNGMPNLIKRFKPVFIIEGDSPEVLKLMDSFGYGMQKIDRSPNCIFKKK